MLLESAAYAALRSVTRISAFSFGKRLRSLLMDLTRAQCPSLLVLALVADAYS